MLQNNSSLDWRKFFPAQTERRLPTWPQRTPQYVKKSNWNIFNASNRTYLNLQYTYLSHYRVLKLCKHVIPNREVWEWITENDKTPRKEQGCRSKSSNRATKAIWSSLSKNMTMQNDDLSQLLSFDTTITSKLNFAVFFDQKASQIHSRMCRIRYSPKYFSFSRGRAWSAR